jgi:ADP-ribose pyrophosphatase
MYWFAVRAAVRIFGWIFHWEVRFDVEESNERRIIYRGRKVDLAVQTVPARGGGTLEREVVLHRGAVALLVLLDSERLCLVRNRRFAVDATLLEVPAGTLDSGEDPRDTAVRELKEETGYSAGRVELVKSWWVSPGLFTERMHLFACQDLTPGSMSLEADEELEPVVVSWTEAMAMVEDGRIDDAKTILSLILGERWLRAQSSAR